jgi:hypothetical protein
MTIFWCQKHDRQPVARPRRKFQKANIRQCPRLNRDALWPVIWWMGDDIVSWPVVRNPQRRHAGQRKFCHYQHFASVAHLLTIKAFIGHVAPLCLQAGTVSLACQNCTRGRVAAGNPRIVVRGRLGLFVPPAPRPGSSAIGETSARCADSPSPHHDVDAHEVLQANANDVLLESQHDVAAEEAARENGSVLLYSSLLSVSSAGHWHKWEEEP